MSWPCFLITPVPRATRTLRRFSVGADPKCPLFGYDHAADGASLIVDQSLDDNTGGRSPLGDERTEPGWPLACACGYAFGPDDYRQVHFRRHHAGNGWEGPLRDAPIGAMWDASWMPDGDAWRGADGRCLVVRLPDGSDWMVDGPASNSQTGWQRTGEPPLITASPSILSHPVGGKRGYHGFLQNGVLTDDLEGRTYA